MVNTAMAFLLVGSGCRKPFFDSLANPEHLGHSNPPLCQPRNAVEAALDSANQSKSNIPVKPGTVKVRA
jgi:hypothetical protein